MGAMKVGAAGRDRGGGDEEDGGWRGVDEAAGRTGGIKWKRPAEGGLMPGGRETGTAAAEAYDWRFALVSSGAQAGGGGRTEAEPEAAAVAAMFTLRELCLAGSELEAGREALTTVGGGEEGVGATSEEGDGALISSTGLFCKKKKKKIGKRLMNQ